MVLGLLILTAIPSVTGVCQAISAQKTREQRQKDENRMRKCNISVEPHETNVLGNEILKGTLVATDGRIGIQPSQDQDAPTVMGSGYKLEAFYIEYPDNERVPAAMGLVSQVQHDPPLLNWIYMDKETLELRYGNKSASIEHHVGSWDWTEDEEYITLETDSKKSSEGFFAVATSSAGPWYLFYDMYQNDLQGYIPVKWLKFQVRLKRILLPPLQESSN